MSSPWSKSEIITLKHLWEDRKTGSEIAHVLGRSRCAVLGKIRRLGLARNPIKPPFDRTHWHCGHPATDENTMGRGRARRCKACSDERAARDKSFVADYLAGMTAQQVADKHCVKVSMVRTAINRLGVKLPAPEISRRITQVARSHPSWGRTPVWPDCPPALEGEYIRLRHAYGYRAAEARAMLEAVA